MELTQILYEHVQEIWTDYEQKPFITGIADGTLPLDRFRYFMIQDYLYLYEYAKVFALGVVKSTDPKMMRHFAGLVHGTLDGEMSTHHRYMERLGITPEEIKDARMSLTNISYTNYMLSVGYNEDILALLVSILSCSWSYKQLGEYLAKLPGTATHPFYGEWVQSYASEAYAADNHMIIDMVNTLGKDCSDETVAHLKDIFKACSRYEGLFWDMAYNKEA